MKKSEAPALREGMQIPELIATSKAPVPFQAIADAAGMSRASVTRLLRVLSDSSVSAIFLAEEAQPLCGKALLNLFRQNALGRYSYRLSGVSCKTFFKIFLVFVIF